MAAITKRPTRLSDGRDLIYYDDADTTLVPERKPDLREPSPRPATATMRQDPLTGEWVSIAAARQNRVMLPPAELDPLAPATPSNPSEIPDLYDVAVFENKSPSFGPLLEDGNAPEGADDLAQVGLERTRTSVGRCEVVCFSPATAGAFGSLTPSRARTVIEAWADRTTALSALPGVRQVFPFENRGEAIGVTLHHPHGQIYAYPVVPPVPARMQELAVEHHAKQRRTVLQDLIAGERSDRRRMLYDGEHAVAFVPVCARYPYEVWVAPVEPVESFGRLTEAQRADLARALKTVLLKYDGLWRRPFPYLMAWYQAPTDGQPHPESHLHAEFYPPYRTPDRLKYLAGTELAAGFFAMDALPEDKARELQQVEVNVA
ncbi:MAG: galactose-1-phosphate uridylyltransferase [Leifsonia sp.]|nr:galactose-1-phosphate uridylyltransferase [Leifsonia sp.]